MKKHIEDYENFDLIDKQNFIDQFEMVHEFLLILENPHGTIADMRIDEMIGKLQKIKANKNKFVCLINTDNLKDALIDEDCDAYDTFQDEINAYENGEMPSAYEDYYENVILPTMRGLR